MSKVNISHLANTFQRGTRRFAMTLLWLTAFTVVAMLSSHDFITDKAILFPLLIGFGNGTLVSLMLKLSFEAFSNVRHKAAWCALSYLAVAAFSLFVYLNWQESLILVTLTLGVEAALVAGILIVPLSRKQGDMPLWHLLMKAVAGMAVSVSAVLVLVGGVNILINFIYELFQFHSRYDFQTDILILGFAWLAPVIFIQFIPNPQSLHEEDTAGLPHIPQNVMRYLFIPLLLIYFLTLYAYAAQILFTWQLPDGNVSWPVSIMMVLLIADYVLLFPSTYKEERKSDTLFFRWAPVMALPLLLLMTVAIGRRLSDYGISVLRLYALAFNLWGYAVCLLMMVPKTRRRLLTLGFTSLTLLLFFTSVGPWSFANVVYRCYRSSIEQVFQRAHLPGKNITKTQLETCAAYLKASERYQFISRLNTLRDAYNKQGMEDRLTAEAWQLVGSNDLMPQGEECEGDYGQFYSTDITDTNIPIPAGSKSVVTVQYHSADVVKSGEGYFVLRTDIGGTARDFAFDLNHGPRLKAARPDACILEGRGHEAILYIISKKDAHAPRMGTKVEFNGILFLK